MAPGVAPILVSSFFVLDFYCSRTAEISEQSRIERESAKVLIAIKKDVLSALPFPVRRAPRKKRSSGPAVLRQIPPPEKVRRSPKRGCLGLWAPGAT